MHAAGVGSRDHIQPDRGVRRSSWQVGSVRPARRTGVRSGSAGALRESTAPSTSGGSPSAQRCASSRSAAAYSVTAPLPISDAGRGDRGRQATGHRGECGAGRSGHQHVDRADGRALSGCGEAGTARAGAARPEDGQPDLHRRQRSLLSSEGPGGVPFPPPPPGASARTGPYRSSRVATVVTSRTGHAARAPLARPRLLLCASSHLPLTLRPVTSAT